MICLQYILIPNYRQFNSANKNRLNIFKINRLYTVLVLQIMHKKTQKKFKQESFLTHSGMACVNISL